MRGNPDVAAYWFPKKILDLNEDDVMHATVAARKFCIKDAEVVLLVNPAPSQVQEITSVDYVPENLLAEKCFPKAHPWP